MFPCALCFPSPFLCLLRSAMAGFGDGTVVATGFSACRIQIAVRDLRGEWLCIQVSPHETAVELIAGAFPDAWPHLQRYLRLQCATSGQLIEDHTTCAKDLSERGQVRFVLALFADLGDGQWITKAHTCSGETGRSNADIVRAFVIEAKQRMRQRRKALNVQIRGLVSRRDSIQLNLEELRNDFSSSESDSARSTPTEYSLPSGCSDRG